jgi:hypothetical protein
MGSAYEAITQVVLEDYSSLILRGERVYSHISPPNLAVEPDFTIGRDSNSPRLLFLISHTNAERASEKKFWRNIGEFADVRAVLGPSVVVINLAFESFQKRRLMAASSTVFDSVIEIDRAPYGPMVLQLAADLGRRIAAGSVPEPQRPDLARELVARRPAANACLIEFGGQLSGLVRRARTRDSWYASYTRWQNTRPTARVPADRVTSLRRGLGRLLPVVEGDALEALVAAIKQGRPTQLPSYFKRLGLAQATIRGSVVKDTEIVSAVNLVGVKSIHKLWASARSGPESLMQALEAIRCSDDFGRQLQFVVSNFEQLATRAGLQTALKQCYDTPDFVLGQRVGLTSNRVGLWLFDFVTTVLKVFSGKQQGFGYTALDGAAGTKLGTSIGPHLSRFVSRAAPLRDDLLRLFSGVLALRLRNVGKQWLNTNDELMYTQYLRGLFEDKVYKAAKFDPLKDLIQDALTDVKAIYVSRHPTYLSTLSQGVATTALIAASDCLVLWQTAHGNHCNDKSKELMGRLSMLGTVKERGRIRRHGVVIDGDWTDRHIRKIVSSGADAVFYPDEMDELRKWVTA